MNVVPARWMGPDDWKHGEKEPSTGDLKDVRWTDSGLVVQCVVSSPKSTMGSTVWVHIRNEEVEWLMKELRQVAIERRNVTIREMEARHKV